ncbi:MAG: FAD-binding oxidoreductase, partial [Chloroflexota bacterium]|nr:FAD-binding oxidoreductase [Chloroflexota bacterium]
NVAGHAVADGALVVDLRAMRSVVVDAERRRARVAGGALWEHVDAATTAQGLAMPGGTFGDTGVAGLALGGGIGWLMGTSGLTCDTLVRAEVVTADGSIVIAGEGGDPELLWALRGGGGNFGVVTEFEFALQPIGMLHAGDVSVPIEHAAEAMRVIAEVTRSAPPELAIFAGGPAAFVEEDGAEEAEEGAPIAFWITVVYQGSAEEAEPHIRPILALPQLGNSLSQRTYIETQQMPATLPFGLRHYWKGHFVRALDSSTIDAVVVGMSGAVGSSFVLLEAITGAARQEPAGGAAFGQRTAHWNISAIAVWEEIGEDPVHIGWARAFTDALRPSSLTGAGYANYSPVDETPERVLAAFGAERFERLARVKRRYDPDNAFRFNLNIPPAPAG